MNITRSLTNKALLLITVGCSAFSVLAVSIPTPSPIEDSYRVRGANGFTCDSSTTAPLTLQAGLYNTDNRNDSSNYNQSSKYYNDNDTNEIGAFVSVVVPIGRTRAVNCNRLYELELSARALEVQQLREEIKLLKIKTKRTTFTN